MNISKKIHLLPIVVVLALLLGGYAIASTVESDVLSVSFTLIRSALSDTITIGFTLIESVFEPVTDTLMVGFTLIETAIQPVSDTVGIGFTLIREFIDEMIAVIFTSFHLTESIAPTPTPSPGFYASASSNCPVYINQSAEFTVSMSGINATPPYTCYWSFGDGTEGMGENVSHIYPTYWRSWYANVIVVDSLGHTAEDETKCCIVRTKTNETLSTLDDSAYEYMLNAFTGQTEGGVINESATPNFLRFAEGITLPFTAIVGNLFFALFFAAFFYMMWLRQENILIPSTIGIITGGLLLGFAPAEFRLAAILFISLSIFGVIYMLLKERG